MVLTWVAFSFLFSRAARGLVPSGTRHFPKSAWISCPSVAIAYVAERDGGAAAKEWRGAGGGGQNRLRRGAA